MSEELTEELSAVEHEQVALDLKAAIIAQAVAAGFDLVGVASPAPFSEARRALEERIEAGLVSGLRWFTKERAEVAGDPRNLLPCVRSILSVGISYLGDDAQIAPSEAGMPRGRVARYAWGEDYHHLFKQRMTDLHARIAALLGRDSEARTLVDTARIVDRAVAQRAGLGWYGKNSNILTRRFGSWVLLGEILLDVFLPPDAPVRTHCGSCTRCMPACPTGALIAPGVLHNDRCISYLTIEHKGPIPRELRPLIGDWVFGCDICQEVCPVNSRAEQGGHDEFGASRGIGPSPDLLEILSMDEPTFRERFRRSPVKRAKLEGLKRNAAIALGNIKDPRTLPSLARALNDTSELVRGHAAWALGRIGGDGARTSLTARLRIEQDDWVREEIGLALASTEVGGENGGR